MLKSAKLLKTTMGRKEKGLWRLQTFAASRTVPLVRVIMVITMCALNAPTGSDNSTDVIAKMQIPRSMRTHDLAMMSRTILDSNIFCVRSGLFAPGDLQPDIFFYEKGRIAGDRHGAQISSNDPSV